MTTPKNNKFSSINSYLQTSQWAILPDMLSTIHQIVETRMNGKLSLDEIAAKIGAGGEINLSSYTNEGVRVIPINGTISKRMNMFSNISGGVSTEEIKTEIEEALKDDSIDSILMDIESPGGSVDGIFDLSDFIYASRGIKPIRAFANGIMASAAYLIGSATDSISGSQSAEVGSIGVITKHIDNSKKNEKDGVVVSTITSGKYKSVGGSDKPLSNDDRAIIQSSLDYYYTLFVDAVARNRNVSAETVVSDMADGRIFIGQQAVDAGLMDQVGTLETAITGSVVSNPDTNMKAKSSYIKINAQKSITKGGEEEMTFSELKADKELYEAMKNELSTESQKDAMSFEKRIADFETKLAESNSLIAKLQNENEKREAMRLEADRRSIAKELISSKLCLSRIPERLYGKVTSLVDCSKFMENVDTEKFSALVDTEISDWEGLDLNPSIDGAGATVKGETSANSSLDDADAACADKIFEMI